MQESWGRVRPCARCCNSSKWWLRAIRPCFCWARQAPARNSSRAPFTIAAAARSRAFVKLNCAAIPSGLLESELFGHERGAFTGAITQKIGRLELADQGSLFLDEIGDIPLELQPKLLRVLQEREFERLGSTRTKKVDVRVVAATHRDLEEMIVEKQFRSDLYYRLNVFPISIPPLRERPEDIPLLVRHFVRQFAQRMNKTIDAISSETMEALTRYPWPGNIRELQNVIERAVVIYEKGKLPVKKSWLCSRMLPQRTGDPRFLQKVCHGGSRDDWRCPGRNARPGVWTVRRGSQAWNAAIHP